MGKTLTRAEISERLSSEVALSRNKANEILEDIMEEMIQGLVYDGYLKLSSFGSFTVRQKSERIGRNPMTGIEAEITPRKTISFRPSHLLKKRVVKVNAADQT